MHVSCSGLDIEISTLDCQNGDIEGASTKIENKDITLLLKLLVETVSDCSSCWLVNDAQHVEPSYFSGILCRLALRIVEIGWDCYDCIRYGHAEVGLCSLLHFCQDH